jgi:prolyl 4-hydroxylase
MDNYIRTYDKVLDEDSCKLLIDKFEKFEDRQETVLIENNDKAISFNQINMYNYEAWEGIRERLISAMLHYVKIYKSDCNITPEMWPPLNEVGFEAIRMKRYLPNGFDRFDDHVDSTKGCERRFLNFLIYLNDVDEGGETEFPQMYKPGTYIPLSVKPKVGRMVIFPPMWPWLHAGRKPVSGPKYFTHSYLHYV